MRKSAKMASLKGETSKMHLIEAGAARQVVYLTKDEVERLFRQIPVDNARDRLLFDLMYRYGLRRREASLMRLEHLSDGRVWILRVKRGVSGEYPVHPFTRRLLWAHLRDRKEDANPYVFRTRQSGLGPISPSTIASLFRKYAEAAGLPKERQHSHVLRHSIATHLRAAGWDIADIQDWIGHKDIGSTMIYAAVINTRREAAYQRALTSPEIANNAS